VKLFASRPWEADVDPTVRRAGRERPLLATFVSVAAHLALGGFAAFAVARHLSQQGATSDPPPVVETFTPPSDDEPIVVELPPATESDMVAPNAPKSETPPSPELALAGGAKVEHPDEANAGKGGDPDAIAKARNLAPRADEDTVASQLRDDLLREQENRLKTSLLRESDIDRREALEPMELTFVASGKGFRYDRKPVAKSDAAFGTPTNAPPSVLGGALGASPKDGEGSTLAPSSAGGAIAGSALASPKPGAAYGEPSIGSMQIVGANVVKARPHVDKGKPSVSANDKGSSKDDVDSDQAVAAALKSLVDTSTAGSPEVGDGKGGEAGGGDPGSGGKTGSGSTSVAMGDGNGPLDGLREKRRLTFFFDLEKRLKPLVAGTFPKEDEMELRSGTVIVDLVIAKPGNVLDVVVIRPSGFKSFDQNVVVAIRGAGTLLPVPDLLSDGSNGSITIRMPVQGGWYLH
jgi:TonB family protein